MGEATPKPSKPAAAAKLPARTPMAARLQSPTRPHPFPLGSNDDQLERAQARAARAASIRRASTALSPPPRVRRPPEPYLDHDQIMDLFHNCIKLASENKINQKNTWELGLIDHLSEIIHVRCEEDDETNFQKASCTLEASVKIYSLRVDSVHSEAYKVLGGINRAGREEEEKEIGIEGDHIQTEQGDSLSKKESDRKLSPLSTLESSFDALNVKKFDVAFTVDPLYHQTSAQFDEGGAKGLLLNNLGVYGGCRVIFDSFEVPEKSMLYEKRDLRSELIDLLFAKECIEQMMINVPATNEISPTLRDIVNQFDEDNCRPSDVPLAQQPVLQEGVAENNHSELGGNSFDDSGPWNFDNDDNTSVVDDSFPSTDANLTSHHEEDDNYTFRDADMDQKLEKVAGFLSLGLGFTSKSNAWAGPDHWKYRKAKCVENIPSSVTESELATKKKKMKKGASDIDFTKSLDKEMSDIFAPPKNPKSLLVPANRVACNITLPEDCHYRPENLVRLFVLPNIICLGKKARKSVDEPRQQNHDCMPPESWDGSTVNDQFDDGYFNSDAEDVGTLVQLPRQVNKVDIQYDKVSKQVDVHALKDMLWNHIQESVELPEAGVDAKVSLRHVLHQFASDCITTSLQDISPHLFFICLLHLANEHSLSLRDWPTLDELDICIPSSALVK